MAGVSAGSALAALAGAKGLLQRVAGTGVPQCSEKERRGAAVKLIRDFAEFAEKVCGCRATSNRAHLRRAVFQAGEDLSIERFVEDHLQGDASSLETLAKMECPVTLPDKSMLKVKVAESAPKRIVFASKGLRQHLSLTETQTCRGCLKRRRCRFFKAPAQQEETANVRQVTRVLFGMAQYSRAHLQQPEAFPFYFTPHELNSARTLLTAVAGQLAETTVPMYSQIEVADEKTARTVSKQMWARQEEHKQKFREDRVLALPQWIRDTLKPIPGPGMSKKQRELLANGIGNESGKGGGKAKEGAETTLAPDLTPEAEWVEEGATPGELLGPMLLDPVPPPHRRGRGDRSGEDPASADGVRAGDDDGPITVVGGQEDISATRRFEHLPPRWEEKTVPRFSSVAGGATSQVVLRTSGDEARSPRVDLNAVSVDENLFGPDGAEAPLAELQGGYTIVDMLSSTSFDGTPKDVLHYVSMSPGGFDGVHEYRVGQPQKKVDARVLEGLWKRQAEGQKELPFLSRVPFDAGARRSGGSAPPARLDREKLLQRPEPIVPPPDRRPQGASESRLDEAADAAGQPAAEPSAGLVELDAPGAGPAGGRGAAEAPAGEAGLSEEVFAADEDLVAQVLKSGAESRRRATMPVLRSGSEADQASTSESVSKEDSEDLRFTAWSGRPKRRGVSILDPSVDFSRLSQADRLEHIGELGAEADIPVHQGTWLAQDEEFVSTFRRPLTRTAADDSDPLGAAAPGVDIGALKREVAADLTGRAAAAQGPKGLEQDSRFVMGGSLKFPKLPEAPASLAQGQRGSAPKATQRTSPRTGRLRQARLEDLSDLMRPGGAQPLGQVSRPQDDAHDAPSDRRAQLDGSEEVASKNAALAVQQMLNKRLKQTVKRDFPRSRGGSRR